ncbi:TlpA family protein disulfide reductase [Mucilaginibacter sp. Bleaf8]|uniref:TlpA family protein disulfide reductase n=1 Tax=Mucilaginibacter sp. Bleaf8 TaxID=2834430 RepID=UPI001BCEF232|nr:TlpA disulfide reductase family protein [Mucilaginibacter sp. Bleaf8]MBS7566701.1 TlpA family protein disulfide reductase [Mucilaginibacter sp. Bleaf8]
MIANKSLTGILLPVYLLLHFFTANAQGGRKNQPGTFKAEGVIHNITDTVLAVTYISGKDTINKKIKPGAEGKVMLTGVVTEPTLVLINEGSAGLDPSTGQPYGKVKFWVEPGKTTTFSFSDEAQGTLASGNITQEEYNSFDRLYKATVNAQQNIIKRGGDAKKAGNFNTVKPQLDKEWDSIEVSKRNIIVNFLKQHKQSYVSLYLVQEYKNLFKWSGKTDELIAAYHSLSSGVKSSPRGAGVAQYLGLEGDLRIGAPIKEINEKNPSGQYVSLAGLKGKYVLIDFWASWCAPCRMEIPELKKIYQKFKDKSFTILSVSIDDNREKWVKAVNEEKMEWPNVSDLKGSDGLAAKTFNIHAIPQNILVDPDGKIIAKNLNMGELNKKLESYVLKQSH